MALLNHTMTNDSKIRILTADDHALMREGIVALIASAPDMTVVGTAATGREAVAQFRALRPDVTLMDLQMPDLGGLDALIAIRAECPAARIIVLTMYAGDAQILHALKAGASGYLLKNLVHEELLEAIRTVHAGRRIMSPEASFELASYANVDTLTPTEVDVLALVAAGKPNRQIAHLLGVTEDTVKGRVRSILSKLNADDRTHAVTIALKRGIIDLP
jgi:DNA-binding NarL/FixJ family response regulator